ncbi:MAG: hypothetical protein IPO53_14540 [Chitinophagaceae bacterium]|nr:hypothetical protein [Chitinophagaceae bacterium]
MKKQSIYFLAIAIIVVAGCQKELSIEGSSAPAVGSLQDDVSGDCLPKTVNGVFVAGTALVPATNTISVQVNVTKTGTYLVSTDTVNGYFFRTTGTFTTLGANNVILRSSGTPFAAGINNFVVSFDTTFCDIQVTVLPAGSGPAVFTLAGAPATCTTPVIAGTYATGNPLIPTNTVTLNVNVTTAGTYNVSTAPAVGGMTFSGTGSLTTGAQTIVLTGTGTPTVGGNNTIPVTVGASTCSFVINVLSPAVFTLAGSPGSCTTPVIAGTYALGTPLTPSNTVTLNVNVTTAGPYSVSTAPAVGGMTFSGSGTLALGPQTILLTGTGTPTVSGNNTFPLTVGASNCSFVIVVTGGGSAFTPDCSTATPDGLYEATSQLNCSNTVDIDINVTALGPYNIVTTATNGMTFSKSGTFTTLGVQTITLIGSGTPLVAGTFNIPMPGTTPCTFPLIVDAPLLPIEWKFTVTNAPATAYQGQTDDAQLVPNGTSVVFVLLGSNSAGSDNLSIALSDINGTITAGETYSTNGLPIANFAIFSYDLAASLNCSDTYSADPTVIGASMTFTVTSHNVATKTITGTFTGTAKNIALQTITITSGTFTGTYL